MSAASTTSLTDAACPCGLADIPVAGLSRDGHVRRGSTATCPRCDARLVCDGATDGDESRGLTWQTWRVVAGDGR